MEEGVTGRDWCLAMVEPPFFQIPQGRVAPFLFLCDRQMSLLEVEVRVY